MNRLFMFLIACTSAFGFYLLGESAAMLLTNVVNTATDKAVLGFIILFYSTFIHNIIK